MQSMSLSASAPPPQQEVSDGVLQLVGAIESTWVVLQEAVATLRSQQSWESQCDATEENTDKTADQVYMDAMRSLQFGKHVCMH